MPTPAEPASKPKVQAEEDEEIEDEEVDDKLYCVCKTSYDEDKVMIACDRCDEWYHTQCLNMNDLEVDLIDQFVCPPCVEANPHLQLHTTYKQRCTAGLKHPRPSSPSACHKPARGAFSKFCSDECGIAHAQRRIEGWGGNQAGLWESVKDAKQREGVVVEVQVIGGANGADKDGKLPDATFGHLIRESYEVRRPTKTQRDRKIARLQVQLDTFGRQRDELKKDVEMIQLRQRVFELAERRASMVQECGLDYRLCFDDQELTQHAEAIFESYEEGRDQLNGSGHMHADAAMEDADWWCRGHSKCQRHAGWQKLRSAEYTSDLELKESTIHSLTMRERDLRNKMEDASRLPVRAPFMSGPPLQALNGTKAKPNGTSGGKGKQKH